MTLEEYFGLSKLPFPKAVTDEALLMTPSIEHVLNRMQFALRRDTITLLAAESGCSKSTVLSLFAKSLDAASYSILATSLTTLSPFSFIAHLVATTGLPGRRFKGETAAALLMHLRSQPRRTVILVDEAHLLPDASLEDLRLLTADDLDRHSPFALVLVGQPILRDRIAEPQHYALWQRIGIRLRLRPLTEEEVQLFLDRHLKAAGHKKKTSLFEPQAVAEIFHHSRGIPRLVQNIALDAMFDAMTASKKTVDAEAVGHAIVDMEAD
jgi:type II secretory pathway predicted ATPase ExeA